MFQSSNRSLRFLPGALIVALMLALHPASPAYAASFTVTSTGDQPDADTTDGLCRIARSNNCTLRAAIQQANASPGNDTITFMLGTATISPASPLPDLTDDKGVTIRGDGRITLDGSRAKSNYGISIPSSRRNKIQGLNITNFPCAIVITGALFEVATDNIIGTDSDGINDAQERNIIRNSTSGISISGIGANHNTIAGNFIGTNAAGTNAAPNQEGIHLGRYASYTLIGTNGDGINDAGEGNVISGNNVGIMLYGTNTATIAGNIIGLAANGNAPLPNSWGIYLQVSNLNRIGTDANGIADAQERNVISSNRVSGIEMDAVSNTVIAGNFIGTQADGSGDRGNGRGIIIMEANFNGTSSNIMIGGDTPEEGNIIAHSTTVGVAVRGDVTAAAPVGISILSNRIFDSGTLGIDLVPLPTGPDVDPNDPGDGDAGPNNLLNHPVLNAASSGGGTPVISGSITNGLANTTITIQFFSNPSCHSSGHGEGRQFLGSTVVTTDAAGNASINAVLTVPVNTGQVVTATATDSAGNTSEFSACVTVANN